MAAYNQAVAKRQKTREPRTDNVDYFQGIDKVEYNNMASPSESLSYRYYNSSERVHSRSMEEWLKYSISFTEFRSNGSDTHGRQTFSRTWDDNTDSVENHKRSIKALFDLCSKLGIKYWTAFDSDLVPYTEGWEEYKTHWDEIVEYIQELTQKYHVKLLWLAPDLHSHPRYNMLGGVILSNEVNHYDSKMLTLMMKCIVDQGTTPPGGINLKLCPRRDSDLRESVTTYVKYIDAVAKALRLACNVIAEQIVSKHLQQRYSSYHSGFGSRILGTEISMEECEEHYKKNPPTHSEMTSKHEHLDVVFQRHLDACDHI